MQKPNYGFLIIFKTGNAYMPRKAGWGWGWEGCREVDGNDDDGGGGGGGGGEIELTEGG